MFSIKVFISICDLRFPSGRIPVDVCKRSCTMPPTSKSSARHDMSVVLVTGSYDHEIRFWEAWSGICSRTIARTGESGVFTTVTILL